MLLLLLLLSQVWFLLLCQQNLLLLLTQQLVVLLALLHDGCLQQCTQHCRGCTWHRQWRFIPADHTLKCQQLQHSS
jgi:hypothetical protein